MKLKDITSCRIATELISKSLEEKLTFGETIKLNVHLIMCRMCIKYRRQLRGFHKIFGQYTSALEKDSPPSHKCLPEEKKDAIKKLME